MKSFKQHLIEAYSKDMPQWFHDSYELIKTKYGWNEAQQFAEIASFKTAGALERSTVGRGLLKKFLAVLKIKEDASDPKWEYLVQMIETVLEDKDVDEDYTNNNPTDSSSPLTHTPDKEVVQRALRR